SRSADRAASPHSLHSRSSGAALPGREEQRPSLPRAAARRRAGKNAAGRWVQNPWRECNSLRMHDLIRAASEVVRLLPSRGGMKSNQTASRYPSNYVWTPPRDFREICACQRHARLERALWRRALRVAKRRGVALLVTVPLAFGAIGI